MRYITPLLFLGLAVSLLLFGGGCASPTQQKSIPEPEPISSDALATFYYLKYLQLEGTGSPDEARNALHKAIEHDPAPELYIELGRHFWHREEAEQAKKAIQSGLRNFPGNSELMRLLARLYLEREELENATALLDVYLRKHQADQDTIADLGRIYLEQQRYREAQRLLQHVQQKERKPSTHYLLGESFLGLEEFQAAIRHYRRAVEGDPQFLEAWSRLGRVHQELNEFAKAEEAYSTVHEQGKNGPNLLLELANLNLKLNKPERAMDYVRNGPRKSDFLLQACSFFLRAEFYERARGLLDMLPEGEEQSPHSLYYRAIIAFHQDNAPEKALQHLEEIPSNSQVQQNRLLLQTQILFEKDRMEAALDKARQGRRDFPGAHAFWGLESNILIELDQVDKARDILEEGLQEHSRDPELLFQLGFVEHEGGNQERALELMRRVLDKQPDHDSALNFLGYTLVEQERDLDKAGRMIHRALELDPDNPYYLDSLAWYYFKRDKLKKAWETIKKAVSQVGDDPTIWEHYGRIAEKLSKKEQARKGYENALELEPETEKDLKDRLEGLSE